MQKFIRLAAIVAAALVALSLLLLIVMIPFQPLLVRLVTGSASMVEGLPFIPFTAILYCFARLCCILPLAFAPNKKRWIILDIAVFLLLMVGLPFVSTFLSTLETTLFYQYNSAHAIAARNYVSSLSSIVSIPASLGHALAYAVCGMRFVFARMSKKEALPETEVQP